MPEVYIHMRDADVDRTVCLNAVANADYDANGGLVGIEVLGAVRVDVDGVQVTPQALAAGAIPAGVSIGAKILEPLKVRPVTS